MVAATGESNLAWCVQFTLSLLRCTR